MPRLLVHQWDQADIHAECAGAYAAFLARRRERYEAYFAAHPELADASHTFKARDLRTALPETGPAELADWLPAGLRHPHYRSGNSSQTLALALLGTAAQSDRSLGWLSSALDILVPLDDAPEFAFEKKLARGVLGEAGGATSVDFFVADAFAVFCCECKWIEQGVGACTCASAGGDPVAGRCRENIYATDAYWETAADVFRLNKHRRGEQPCRLGFVYQAVRNVAAALALAKDDALAVFALFYDATNPYFGGHGEWPGWPTVLEHTLDGAHPRLEFRAASWQELIGKLPLDDGTRAWASEKHGLG